MQQVATLDTLKTTTFGGRRFTRLQLQQIIDTVHTFRNLSRKELALTIAEHFSWKNAGSSLKVNSCLTLLENLESLGLIKLPPARQTKQPAFAVVAERYAKCLDAAGEKKHAAKVRAEIKKLGR